MINIGIIINEEQVPHVDLISKINIKYINTKTTLINWTTWQIYCLLQNLWLITVNWEGENIWTLFSYLFSSWKSQLTRDDEHVTCIYDYELLPVKVAFIFYWFPASEWLESMTYNPVTLLWRGFDPREIFW